MRLLVLGDSLTFHGPDAAHPPSDPRLWPNLAADHADVVAQIGWMSRDVWWSLTRDPKVWGEYLPGADALMLAIGGMDALPAAIPTYLRQGISYVRPGSVRRKIRAAYLAGSPKIIHATGGPWRQLPQAATDHYLTRVVQAVRTFHPQLPIAVMTPPPHRAQLYPSQRFFADSVAACHAWAQRYRVAVADVTQVVQRGLDSGTHNPDGMHFGWDTHQAVAEQVRESLRRASVP